MASYIHPLDRRRYIPLTPSPLNPNTYFDIDLDIDEAQQQNEQPPQHQYSRRESNRSSRRTKSHTNANPSSSRNAKSNPQTLAQRYAALASESPTQRLLRQKAAAAWRSETLRHHYHHHLQHAQTQLHAPPRHHLQGHHGQYQHLGGRVMTAPLPLPLRPLKGQAQQQQSQDQSQGREYDEFGLDDFEFPAPPPPSPSPVPRNRNRTPSPSSRSRNWSRGSRAGDDHGHKPLGVSWAADLTLEIPLLPGGEGGSDDSEDDDDLGLFMAGSRSRRMEGATGPARSATPTITAATPKPGHDEAYVRVHSAGEVLNQGQRRAEGIEGEFVPAYRDIDTGVATRPDTTNPSLASVSPMLGYEGGARPGRGASQPVLLLPLHMAKQRAGRRHLLGGRGKLDNARGVVVKRLLIVAALFLGLALVHAFVGAFSGWGGV